MKIPRLVRTALRTFAIGGIALGAAQAADNSASASCYVCQWNSGGSVGCAARDVDSGGGGSCNISVSGSTFSCVTVGSCHSG
jgi:hypothetical protein